MKTLKGKDVADRWTDELQSRELPDLKLGIVLVGDDEDSATYVRKKREKADQLGVATEIRRLSADADKDEIMMVVEELNQDPEIGGFLVQLPLPNRNWENEVLNAVDPKKDIDGLNQENLKHIADEEALFIPATARAVERMLEFYDIDHMKQSIAVVGQGRAAGRPISDLLSRKAEVKRVDEGDSLGILKECGIVISAVGQPHLLGKEHFAADTVVIDVGFSRADGEIIGDVDPEGLEEHLQAFAPVPGGVGPVTVTAIFDNFSHLRQV